MEAAAALPAPTPEPQRRLAPAARWLWRVEGVGLGVGALALAATVDAATSGWAGPAALAAAVVVAVCAVLVVPELRWRRWRWEVREHEVDIRRGTLTITRTLVPMLRVQHVDTRRGVLEQMLGLATVVFHTAAGENRIPALPLAEAGRVRERIAELARTADEL
jgi:membrane protein YdbS with pleckstrin-like domain